MVGDPQQQGLCLPSQRARTTLDGPGSDRLYSERRTPPGTLTASVCSSLAHRSRMLFLELPTSAQNTPPDARADWWGPETPGCPFMAASHHVKPKTSPKARPRHVGLGRWLGATGGASLWIQETVPTWASRHPCSHLCCHCSKQQSLEASVSWPSPGGQWASDGPVHPGQASPSHWRRMSALDSSPQEN